MGGRMTHQIRSGRADTPDVLRDAAAGRQLGKDLHKLTEPHSEHFADHDCISTFDTKHVRSASQRTHDEAESSRITRTTFLLE
ncbi:hypothetical protein PCASD_24675 [Puccinia coronata f. sp. avenae]|uniref:Uncharacterized protein n=1 Tax=Puccinia coronata f. sp. avenae TaxID=200324 RepID=A0A2N5RZQ3_9BASI|nr:hypothetical protein PCASD_24675 [Puccinia coronata f. sp. avenae]